MLTIAHISDPHVGKRPYGRVSREQDILDAMSKAVEVARDHRAAALTISGDLMDSVRQVPRNVRFLMDLDRRLRSLDMPCLVSVGNHDLSDPHWAEVWRETPHVPGAAFGPGFTVLRDSWGVLGSTGRDLRIWGASFTDRQTWEDQVVRDIAKADPHLVLMHQAVVEFCQYPSDHAFDCRFIASTLRDAGCRSAGLVAVGDTHVSENRSVPEFGLEILSPGGTEIFTTGEISEKNVWLSSWDAGALQSLKRLAMPIRDALKLRVDTEDELQRAAETVRKSRGAFSVVELSINTTLADGVPRFVKMSGLDVQDTVFRPRPYTEIADKRAETPQDTEAEPSFRDYVGLHVPPKTPEHALALVLADPETDAHVAVQEHVRARMAELGIPV